MSTLLEEQKTEKTSLKPELSNGDHDKFSHFYKKDDVDRAIFTGEPAKALCGKEDIPLDAPSKYPECPTCRSIYDGLKD